jgi:hypothetical protein
VKIMEAHKDSGCNHDSNVWKKMVLGLSASGNKLTNNYEASVTMLEA